MTSPATQELESAMAKLRKSAAAEQNHRLSEAEAAALLQHIAALQSEVTTAHARADDWHQRASQMLIDLTKAQRSVAALTQRVEKLDAENIGQRRCIAAIVLQCGGKFELNKSFFIQLTGMCTVEVTDPVDRNVKVIRVLPDRPAALSQEPRNG